MDIKSKKSVLFAMRMNDAVGNIKIKLTNYTIVDLAMFANVCTRISKLITYKL